MLNSNGFRFQNVTFVSMKNKITLVSLSFSILIIAAMFLQSLHSFHHLEKFISEKHCHHKYAQNKTQISHTHHDFDHCFVCEFTFSSSTEITTVIIPSEYSFFYNKVSYLSTSESILFYSGCSFSLRGPPIV